MQTHCKGIRLLEQRERYREEDNIIGYFVLIVKKLLGCNVKSI